MSDHERLAQVAHQKLATMSESLIFFSESLIPLFFCKKEAIRSENQGANSQPCFFLSLTVTKPLEFLIVMLEKNVQIGIQIYNVNR